MRVVIRGALAAAAASMASSSAAEVTETSPHHFISRNSVIVKADPQAAWLALIEPSRWWDSSHTWSGAAANLSLVPQGGGCFCERLPEKDMTGSAQHMTVVMAEPMKMLRMHGGLGPLQSEPVDGVLTITLEATPSGGTKLVWEYVVAGHMRYPIDQISVGVDQVMGQQLLRLANNLGRTEPNPAADLDRLEGMR